jgi:hypothetical protein
MIAAILVFFACVWASWLALRYPRTFFSVLWRISLFVLLFCSTVFVWVCLDDPPLAEYRTQFLVAGSIGLIAALSGLARSFFFDL